MQSVVIQAKNISHNPQSHKPEAFWNIFSHRNRYIITHGATNLGKWVSKSVWESCGVFYVDWEASGSWIGPVWIQEKRREWEV